MAHPFALALSVEQNSMVKSIHALKKLGKYENHGLVWICIMYVKVHPVVYFN